MSIVLRYINLDTRSDRRQFFESQSVRLGLDYRRIQAVTPDDLTREDVDRLTAFGPSNFPA